MHIPGLPLGLVMRSYINSDKGNNRRLQLHLRPLLLLFYNKLADHENDVRDLSIILNNIIKPPFV